jgi:hypothetical protein
MAEQIERVTTTSLDPGAANVTDRQVRDVRQTGPALLARVIWYIAGVLLVLLAFRFVLAILGANPANGFASFIYDTSHPFVAPFFSLFGYNLQYGTSKFEAFTLVAMAVYAILAWGLTKLVTLNRPAAQL